ncbi:MAG: hypothetical protein AVDCRST_MAG78-301, partial [uncultured Rubrobacteraceae bacterium]
VRLAAGGRGVVARGGARGGGAHDRDPAGDRLRSGCRRYDGGASRHCARTQCGPLRSTSPGRGQLVDARASHDLGDLYVRLL